MTYIHLRQENNQHILPIKHTKPRCTHKSNIIKKIPQISHQTHMYISRLRLNRQDTSIKTPQMYLYHNSDLIDKISSIIHSDTYIELHNHDPQGTYKPYQNMDTYTTHKWVVYHRTPTTHNNHNIHAT